MISERLQGLHRLVTCAEATFSSQKVSLDKAISSIHDLLYTSKKNSKSIFVIGNGGSAGLASHHAVDLVNVVRASAMAFVEPGLLTCMGNDYGYENTFSRPLETIAHEQDILIAISSSGKSKNILNACYKAKEKGLRVITLSGFHAKNPLRQLGDINIWTGCEDYGLVETAHFFILHTIVDTWQMKEKE